MPPPSMLQIQLLGGLGFRSGDREVLGLDQARVQLLLFFLIVHRDTPQSRHRLAMLFWPDSTEKQAFNNLRTLIFRLRRHFPDVDQYVEIGTDALLWRATTDATVDLIHFETALAQAARAQAAQQWREMEHWLKQAVAAYTGELLPELYDDWILVAREQLGARYAAALTRLVDLYETRGEYRSSLEYAQMLLRHDPLQETTYRLLMRLHALNENRALALRVYHNCVTLLERELGVDPSPATVEVYQRLVKLGDQTESTTAPDLPMSGEAVFVGRQAERRQLTDIWRRTQRGRPQVLLIAGEAGIGKTRLATQLTATVARQGYTSVYARSYAAEGALPFGPVVEWLRSEPIHAALRKLEDVWLAELSRLLPELAQARPDLPHPGPLAESWQQQRLFEALARAILGAGEPLVLHLDDLQWCDDETLAWLHFLVRTYRQTRILLLGTYRPEELTPDHPLVAWQLAMQARDDLTELELGPLTPDESSELAAQMGGQAVSAAHAAALYRTTEGHPLFIVEMARAGTLYQNLHTLVESDPLDPANLTLDLPPKVRAVMQDRLRQLSPPAQELAGIAATIGRDFTFDELAAVSQVDTYTLVRTLDELWQRRIVREQGLYTYDFGHDKLREVAYAGLSRARRGLIHRQVAEALQQLHAGKLEEVYGQIARHYDQAGLGAHALDFYLRAGEHALVSFANHQALAYFQRAVARADTPAQLAHALFGRARAHFQMDQRVAALPDVEQVLALLDPQNPDANGDPADVTLRAKALYLQADIYVAHAQGEAAEPFVRAALAAAEATGDHEVICQSLSLLGQIFSHRGELAAEVPLVTRALELSRAAGNRVREGRALADLAFLRAQMGEFVVAADLAQQALTLLETTLDRAGVAFAANILGRACGGMGAYARAFAAFEHSRQVAEDIDLRSMSVQIPNLRAWLYQELGDYQTALDLDRQGVGLALAWDRVNAEVSSRLNICLDLLHLGDVAGADQGLQAIEARMAQGDYGFHGWRWRLRLLHAQGHCALALGDPDSALQLAQAGLALAQRTQGQKYLALNQELLGAAFVALRQPDKACAALRHSITLADAICYQPLRWRARTQLAQLLEQLNEPPGSGPSPGELRQAAQAIVTQIAEGLDEPQMRATFLASPPIHALLSNA